jgi:hypothetical protein
MSDDVVLQLLQQLIGAEHRKVAKEGAQETHRALARLIIVKVDAQQRLTLVRALRNAKLVTLQQISRREIDLGLKRRWKHGHARQIDATNLQLKCRLKVQIVIFAITRPIAQARWPPTARSSSSLSVHNEFAG